MSPKGYSLGQYGAMIRDEVRMSAYLGAMEAAIFPGAVVMDIGCGPGIMAMLAVRMGASRVYALDPDPSVRLAERAAADNGMADFITVFEGVSTDFDPPERVDVIVSDLRDRLPMNGFSVASVVDARERLLKPDGVQIPSRDTLQAAPAMNEEAYDRVAAAWQTDRYGLDMSSVLRRSVHYHGLHRPAPEDLVAPAQQWATMDYRTITDPSVAGDLRWTIDRDAIAHGLEVWFDADLGFGFEYSNAPDAPQLVYGSSFFTWPRPVDLRAGDELGCELQANLVRGGYVWRWRTTVVRDGETVVSFDQSDLDASLDDPRVTLLRQRPDHVPQLSAEATAVHLVLEAFVNGSTVAEAGEVLAAARPAEYPSSDKAREFVAALSAGYSTACARAPAPG